MIHHQNKATKITFNLLSLQGFILIISVITNVLLKRVELLMSWIQYLLVAAEDENFCSAIIYALFKGFVLQPSQILRNAPGHYHSQCFWAQHLCQWRDMNLQSVKFHPSNLICSF
jgi:hypothetical protein